MWPRCKRVCLLLFLPIALLLSIARIGFEYVAAQGGSIWLGNDAPALAKVLDLTDNSTPDGSTIDCTWGLYVPAGSSTPESVCTYLSPLGRLTTDGQIVLGGNRLARLEGFTPHSFFIPTVDPSIALVSLQSSASGNNVGVYYGLSKANLKADFGSDGSTYYDVDIAPDAILTDPATKQPLAVSARDVFFSGNGEWMVVSLPHQGLARVHMTDLSVQLFAPAVEPDWFTGLAAPQLAISNDGRYAAANVDLWGTGNLNIYDLSTCGDQLDVAPADRTYCTGKDIWQGKTLSAQPMGKGVLDQQADLERPTHLRFVDDNALSFIARYGVTSSGYRIARFVATAPGESMHGLGLLGMGDSYISGEGTFEYRAGTDTSNNMCHLSDVSYPIVLGVDSFNSFNSIACSGATIDKVVGSNKYFEGQVVDGIPEGQRDKTSILSNFQPGYIYQQEFAAAYKPEAILLSIGGNDIGFADILEQCVANEGGGTCYDTYEDRAELVNEIDAAYTKLVATYETIQWQSGGARVYVVGYPQIVKPDGNCGLNVHLNAAETEFAAQLVSYLDGVIQQAADTAGAFYVDTQTAFDGHRLCEAPKGESAVNGLTAGGDTGGMVLGHAINIIGSESYHPTQLGHRLLAEVIAGQTHNLTTAMPIPKAFAIPLFDPAAPILQNLTHTGRQINWVTSDDTMASDFMFRGDAQLVTVDGAEVQLRPGSKYQIVLHSMPILLDEGGVSADGNITATIRLPADVPPGFHVLHIYGTDMAGENVDIQKTVYVAASADDYDGDGTPNTASQCAVLPMSGQDNDRDGIDDACDLDVEPSLAGISAADIITVDQGVPVTSVEQANTDQQESTKNSILGTAVISNSQTQQQNATNGTFASHGWQILRLNWLIVLEVGLGGTVAATAAYYCMRR